MAAGAEEEDMSWISFRDDYWLERFPLNSVTVLDYFALSKFYDKTCNNEYIKMQRQDISMLKQMVGIEYEVVVPPLKMGTDMYGQPCVLPQTAEVFVIQKQRRISADQVARLSVSYCLFGSLYQAPHLLPAIHCRIQNCIFNIKQAFEHDVKYMSKQPKRLEREEAIRKAKINQKNRDMETPADHSKAVENVIDDLMNDFPMTSTTDQQPMLE